MILKIQLMSLSIIGKIFLVYNWSIDNWIMDDRIYCVYILASRRNGTLYIGVTNDLVRRVYEHKNNLITGFTKKYNVHQLVYFETVTEIQSALKREKQLKKWNRQWKVDLIERQNSDWVDLYQDLL